MRRWRRVARGAAEAAGVGEGHSLDGSVAADTDHSGQQGVACDLAGDGAAVELEDDAVAGHLAQVLGIGQRAGEDAERRADGLEETLAAAAVGIDYGDALGEAAGGGDGEEVVAGRNVKLAGADEDAGAVGDGGGKIPRRGLDGVRGGQEFPRRLPADSYRAMSSGVLAR